MTFIQVLNNAEARSLVDQIEDLNGSLDGNNDPWLVEIRARLIAELHTLTGFTYTV